jgi:hypothetical protein
MATRPQLLNRRFGRLIVIAFAGVNQWHDSRWKCQCDCGEVAVVVGYDLQRGHTKSCGCYQRDRTSEESQTHGNTLGHKPSKEYRAWANMKTRCLNENQSSFRCYGGRGIKVCERWLHSFENFLADVGRAPRWGCEWSIDRINNDGNYEPGNVRWGTPEQQQKNKRQRKSKAYYA